MLFTGSRNPEKQNQVLWLDDAWQSGESARAYNILEKEKKEMEIMVGKMETVEDMEQRAHISVAKQQKKSSGGAAEREEIQTRQNTAKQPTSYDAVSGYGDTLSISKEGKTASAENGSRLVSGDTEDGIVIRKESGESTINLFVYTESELRQMYLDGDITKAEYDEELGGR